MRPFFILVLTFVGVAVPSARGDVPDKYKPVIKKGLDWLVKQQNPDGSFTTANNEHPVVLTAFAGLALLMEGSTTGKGQYAENLRKATDWLVKNTQKGKDDDGRIGNPKTQEANRYMYGQGFAMLFLASVYVKEEDRERRRELRDVLNRAVQFTVNAQKTTGGWYYISGKKSGDRDEWSVTLCQIQGLQAARMAGVPVPQDTLQKALRNLAEVTFYTGAQHQPRQGRSAFTAGAIACTFNSGDYQSDHVKKWLKYCQRTIAIGVIGGTRIGSDEYTHFYYAQILFALGDTGYEKLFPKAEERLQWSKYRETGFDHLSKTQSKDGSWAGNGFGSIGPVYSTAVHLIVLQMDNEAVPILCCRIPVR